ncbi:MAG TPA: YciI family protein [Kofleriaceae bacterium]
MKFMLMMNSPGKGAYQIDSWPAERIRAHIQFMKDFNVKLKADGEFVDGQGLTGPQQAKLVTSDAHGKPLTDGVFPESKEFLAGFWVVDVDRAERAYELAAAASMAPGPDGQPLHIQIEVRELMQNMPV